MNTPIEQYQQDLANNTLIYDPAQAQAVEQLQRVYEDLMAKPKKRLFKKNNAVKGLYLWGGVGVGKTHLMDIFYESLPFSDKKRMHFHHFMKGVHDRLTQMQGHKNPLEKIAKDFAKEYRVLCFDEFFVNDIADAMILANLFSTLLNQNVTLVTTSNTHPDNLYYNGLQRSKFLPAIELIKNHTDVFNLVTDKDYRLRHLTQAGVFFNPITPENETAYKQLFDKITGHHCLSEQPIEIEGRLINIIKATPHVLWCKFSDLCSVPRSQVDYLQIAKQYHTLFLSEVPIIEAQQYDSITYFINLIDVLYDANVKLILLANAAIDKLYVGEQKAFEYRRTKSRLEEMQSLEYLQKSHSHL